jgi:LysM repeat protein
MEASGPDLKSPVMKVFKFLFLLVLGLLIFGTAGYFAYELFIKPGNSEKKEKATDLATPIPTPTPDPGIPEFNRLKSLQDAGKLAESRDGLTAWISHYPNSTLLEEARRRLGDANMVLLFQAGGTNVVSYTVVKGDSLARIAARHKSNAELIQRANSLPGINLQIGEQLVIPTLDVSIELDRSAKTLTLLNRGAYLKEYTLLSCPPASSKTNSLVSKVLDKSCIAGNKRVAFGQKAYAQGEKSILLVQAPAIVAPIPAPPPASKETAVTTPPTATNPQAILPGGFVLSTGDLLEIFPLVSRNTPVIIK